MGKKTVAVDVDGVLAQYDGWKGIEHFGDPIPGAREFLETLLQKYDVLIHTTRCSEEINKPETSVLLARRVRRWLDQHNLPHDGIWVGTGKPIAVAYIDDRALRCAPQRNPDAFRDVLTALEEMER